MPTLKLKPATCADYRAIAEARLPRPLFDYLDGGAYDEVTLRRNIEDFATMKLKQRVMRDVSTIETGCRLLDQDWSIPVALAPVGLGGMMARRGEVQAKRAADAMGIPFCLSTVAICSLEEVAQVSDKPFWYQLYMLKDRGAVKSLLARALDVGVKTLVFTVDLAAVGARYRDVRNGMAGDVGAWGRLRGGAIEYLLHPSWLFDVGIHGRPHVFGNLAAFAPKGANIGASPGDFRRWAHEQFDPSVTWKDIEWLRREWPEKLIIKGVLDPEDAQSAQQVGADGVIVSNHGGRQLDGVASGITMLPRVVDRLKGQKIVILMDGGVRSGQDVIKARALGADGVLVGRPWVYAVAARGTSGLKSWLNVLRSEIQVTMALTGMTDLPTPDSNIIDEISC